MRFPKKEVVDGGEWNRERERARAEAGTGGVEGGEANECDWN
jgi:hypothetical protein